MKIRTRPFAFYIKRSLFYIVTSIIAESDEQFADADVAVLEYSYTRSDGYNNKTSGTMPSGNCSRAIKKNSKNEVLVSHSMDVEISQHPALHGRTANEFRYFQNAGDLNSVELYDTLRYGTYYYVNKRGGEKYKELGEKYFEILKDLGYKDEDLIREYANDWLFNSANGYQTTLHADNGGEGYYYIFEARYDYPEDMGAGHAVDCYFLFGNFDGKHVLGTIDQQNLSRWYQKFVVNYATTGNPSMEGLEFHLVDWGMKFTCPEILKIFMIIGPQDGAVSYIITTVYREYTSGENKGELNNGIYKGIN